MYKYIKKGNHANKLLCAALAAAVLFCLSACGQEQSAGNGAETTLQQETSEEWTNSPECISISPGRDETERNFTWYSDLPGEGTLLVAGSGEVSGGVMPDDADAYTSAGTESGTKEGYRYFQVTASGLEPEREYAYQIVDDGEKSEICFFSTDDRDTFSFAFVSDPQIGADDITRDTDGWTATLNLIAEDSAFGGVNFLVCAGDQVDTADDEEQYTAFFSPAILKNLTLAAAIGNHDSDSPAYSEHFNIANASSYGKTQAGSDYYFVYNSVLFLVLNTNSPPQAEHEAFLRQAVRETEDLDLDWKIAVFHHSIFSVGMHAEDRDTVDRRNWLAPLLTELGIDVALAGHDHLYCRSYIMDGLTELTDPSRYDDDAYSSVTNPDGVLYITANSASGSAYHRDDHPTGYAAVSDQQEVPNISRVDVSPEDLTVTTYRTDDMSIVDSFTIRHDSRSGS